MDLECLSGIVENGLAIHIDISDQRSWNLNTGFTSVSLNQWSGAYSDNLSLYDFGLTAFDVGRVDDKISTLDLTPEDLKTTLFRIGYNTVTGGTFYDEYSMSAVTSASTIGNYFNLNGGYLQGFFKLENYNHELLPQRYNEGITIETLVRIDENSEGLFYYMGTRAEDKYNPFFSGETKELINVETIPIRTGVVGASSQIQITTTGYSGVTTSEQNYLVASLDKEIQKNSFISFEEDKTETKAIEQQRDSINENIIAFGINTNNRIYIKRVDQKGIVRTTVSPNILTSTGWTMINITYKPDEELEYFNDLIECAPARLGILTFYINGRKFWELENYKEFFFVGIKNDREKQIGVPYNISWGGGSFGLKHSYHFQTQEYILFNNNNNDYVLSNFLSKKYPLQEDPCNEIIDISDSNVANVSLSADSITFTVTDECDPMITTPINTLRIENTGTTAQTIGQQYFIEYAQPIEVISNRDYDITLKIWENNIFSFGSSKKIKIVVYGTEGIQIIDEVVYGGGRTQQWVDLSTKIRVKDNTGRQIINIGILIDSNVALNENFLLFVDDFKYIGSDKYKQDVSKQNLVVENNFDSSFIGGIQKLRVYTKPFTSQMALHNAKIEFGNNTGYEKTIASGGRIIRR